jgi:hypothetical protein
MGAIGFTNEGVEKRESGRPRSLDERQLAAFKARRHAIGAPPAREREGSGGQACLEQTVPVVLAISRALVV